MFAIREPVFSQNCDHEQRVQIACLTPSCTIIPMYHGIRTVLLIAAATFPAAAQNPYKVSPKNYRLEFENDWVSVSRAMLAPGDKLPVHDHPARPAVSAYLTH